MTLFSGHAGDKKNLYPEIFFFFFFDRFFQRYSLFFFSFFYFFYSCWFFFDVFEIKNVYSDTNLTMRAGE